MQSVSSISTTAPIPAEEIERLRRRDQEWSPWKALLLAILEIFIASALLLAPAIIIYFVKKPEMYDLLGKKFPDQGLSHEVEAIRWSIFSALAYDTYVGSMWLAQAIPRFLRWFSDRTPMVGGARKLISYNLIHLQEIHRYTGWALFTLLVFIEAAIFLYHPTAFKPATAKGALTTGYSALFTAWQYWFERGLILGIIVFSFVALEKWLIKFIRSGFHRTAFLERVVELTHADAVIDYLWDWVRNGGRIENVAVPSRAQRRISRDEAALAKFEAEPTADIELDSTRALAKQKAADILRGFGNIERITRDTLRQAMPSATPEQLEESWAIFAGKSAEGSTSLTKGEFTAVITDIMEQSSNVRRSIRANARIVRKLDIILQSIALFIAFTISTPFFDVKIEAILASFGLLAGTIALAFKNVAQSAFNAFMFVFIEHAFDVGDRVVIGGENFIIQDIEIFTTTMTRWDGVRVYWPNAVLANKEIENIRRSSCQSDTLDLQIGSATSNEKLAELRIALTEWVKSQPQDFSGYLDVFGFDLISKDVMKVQVMVQYRSNFQDQAKRNARRSKFILGMRETVNKLGITFFG